MCGERFDMVSEQIFSEQKSEYIPRYERDYLIRGESNYIFRWSLTLILTVAHVVRIFYFDSGYFSLTSVFGWYLINLVHNYYVSDIHLDVASDMVLMDCNSPDGKYKPGLVVLFRHKLSPQEFDSLVLRILEFKLWYSMTKAILFAFLLTWYTLVRCSYFGPAVMGNCFLWGVYQFVDAMWVRKAKDRTSEASLLIV